MSLTPSHIIEHLYCPRFTFYEYVLTIPQYEHRNYKVNRGRELHDQKTNQNKDYLRKNQDVVKKENNQYLTNALIRGVVDEILYLNDGSMAPLDYKFAKFKDKVYDTYKTQMYCYAWLIEENYSKPVHKAFLVYTRSANKLIEIPIAVKDKENVKQCAKEIYTIISRNFYPKATKYKERCTACTYRNICMK